MNTSTEILLRINPLSNTIHTDISEKGVRRCKEISYQTLVECIRQSLEQESVASGLLPIGCLSFAVSTKKLCTTTILHPERYADVSYEGTEYKNFPLPRLVFKFEHQEGARIMRSWMGVVGTGQLTPKPPCTTTHSPTSAETTISAPGAIRSPSARAYTRWAVCPITSSVCQTTMTIFPAAEINPNWKCGIYSS